MRFLETLQQACFKTVGTSIGGFFKGFLISGVPLDFSPRALIRFYGPFQFDWVELQIYDLDKTFSVICHLAVKNFRK